MSARFNCYTMGSRGHNGPRYNPMTGASQMPAKLPAVTFKDSLLASCFIDYAYDAEGMRYIHALSNPRRVVACKEYDPQVHAALVRNFREDFR